jgi:hypothetical protein
MRQNLNFFQFNLHNSSWFAVSCMYNEQFQTALKTGENFSSLVSGARGTDRMAYLLEYLTNLVHYLFHDFSLLYYCEYGHIKYHTSLSKLILLQTDRKISTFRY